MYRPQHEGLWVRLGCMTGEAPGCVCLALSVLQLHGMHPAASAAVLMLFSRPLCQLREV